MSRRVNRLAVYVNTPEISVCLKILLLLYADDLVLFGLSESGSEVIKHFSCSPQLSMTFVLLIYFKWPTIANSFLLNIADHEIFSANKYENANYCQLSWAWKKFYNLGAWTAVFTGFVWNLFIECHWNVNVSKSKILIFLTVDKIMLVSNVASII